MHAPERDEPLISLIFPTYNPGSRLANTWRDLKRFLDNAPGRWEALFVCDGCTDGSADRLGEWTRRYGEQVRVLSHQPNCGKGYAVRQGLAAARGQWRLFTDVDLAYGFEDVLRVADALRGGADVAIASRVHPDSRVITSADLQGYVYRRHLQSQLFSLLVRCLLPVRQRDTQAGLKGMSAAAAERMLPHLHCNGFGFDCELLTASYRFGMTVAEVPVCVRYEDRESTTSVATVGRMVRELLKVRRQWKQMPLPAAIDPVEPQFRKAA